MSGRRGACDTIFALSSGQGRAGVAVLRISGVRARAALEALAGPLPAPRLMQLRQLRDPADRELLDRALIVWFEGPASFTGEDVAELHIHGGRAVGAGVIAALGRQPGLRAAESGEFTRRAFENGKFDLTAIEGLADLINAETQAQRRQALRQSEGELGALYEGWRNGLLQALALVEAVLDFSDEADVPDQVNRKARPIVEELAREMTRHLDDRHRGERLREGYRVLIAGAPNAGKSSLLNALARREAAIVAAEAGTTRDVIEVHLDLGGLPITVMDSAGIRAAAEGIEQEGIARAFRRAEDADLVIWLVDGGDPQWQMPDAIASGDAELAIVRNKIDLGDLAPAPHQAEPLLEISVTQGIGIDELSDALERRAAAAIGVTEVPTLTRARHRSELAACLEALQDYLEASFEDTELRAEDLRTAAAALGRVTGRLDVEDVLDQLFAEFCIGK